MLNSFIYTDNIAGDKFIWRSYVDCASITNQTLSLVGSTIDGYLVTATDRVLLKNQTISSQNGIYINNQLAPESFISQSRGIYYVLNGSTNGGHFFIGQTGGTFVEYFATSVFGRNGAITAQTNDYSITQIQNSSVLADSANVLISGPTNNQVLTYNSGQWINLAPAVSSVFGRTGAITAQTNDYSITQIQNSSVLADSANVLISGAAANDLLYYTGTQWANSQQSIFNVGGGSGIFRDKTGINLNFRSFKTDANLTFAQNADDLTLSLNNSITVGTLNASTTVKTNSLNSFTGSDISLNNKNLLSGGTSSFTQVSTGILTNSTNILTKKNLLFDYFGSNISFLNSLTSNTDFSIVSAQDNLTFNILDPNVDSTSKKITFSGTFNGSTQNILQLFNNGSIFLGNGVLSGAQPNILTLDSSGRIYKDSASSYLNTVSSVFGRTGAIVATEGDYSLNQLSDVNVIGASAGHGLVYNGSEWGPQGIVNSFKLRQGNVFPADGDYILDQLGDVSLNSPSFGQILTYYGGIWTNVDPPVSSVFGRTGTVIAAEGDYSLTQLSDATITAPTTNQILKYNGSQWINQNESVSSVFGRTGAVVAAEGDYSLTQLSDTTITSPASGQYLQYNGTQWINQNFPAIPADLGTQTIQTNPFGLNNTGASLIEFFSLTVNTTGTISNPGPDFAVDVYLFGSQEASFMKYYKILGQLNETGGAWVIMRPTEESTNNGYNAQFEINITNNVLTGRVRYLSRGGGLGFFNVGYRVINRGGSQVSFGSYYNNTTGQPVPTSYYKTEKNIFLDDLSDVVITTPATNQILKYNGSQWINQNESVSSVFGRTGSVVAAEGDYSLTQLSDATITSPTTNQFLQYDGSQWINQTYTPPVSSVFGRTGAITATEGDYSLTQLSDATITSPQLYDCLQYNGSNFINKILPNYNFVVDSTGSPTYIPNLYLMEEVTGTLNVPTQTVNGRLLGVRVRSSAILTINFNNSFLSREGITLFSASLKNISDNAAAEFVFVKDSVTGYDGWSIANMQGKWIINNTTIIADVRDLNEVRNVSTTSLTSGQFLQYNGSQWINQTYTPTTFYNSDFTMTSNRIIDWNSSNLYYLTFNNFGGLIFGGTTTNAQIRGLANATLDTDAVNLGQVKSTVQSKPSGMIALGTTGNYAVNQFITFAGNSNGNYNTAKVVVPGSPSTSYLLGSLSVHLRDPPGTTNTATVTIYKNNIVSSVTATVASASNTGFYSGPNISVVGTDTFAFFMTDTGGSRSPISVSVILTSV